MAAKKEFKLTDSASRIGDPKNYFDKPSSGGVKLDLTGNRLTQDITRMFQVAVASAMTAAALKSSRGAR